MPTFRPSSRDLSLVGGLLPLFAREITADPEQHDRARREARIKDVREIGKYVRETQFQAEKRQDDELRAKLNGESLVGPLRRPSHRVRQPTLQTAVRPRNSARPYHPATSTDTANMVAPPQRPTLMYGQGSNSDSRATCDAANPNNILLARTTACPATHNTRDQTLSKAGMVASSEVHQSNGAGTDLRAAESSKSVSDPRKTDKKPILNMGAGQLHTPESQEASNVLHRTKQTTHQSVGDDEATIKGTDVKDTSTSLGPTVVPPLHVPGAAVSARGTTFKQQHRSPEAKLPFDLLHRRDFEVKRIREKHVVNGRTLFSVRWRSTWVPLQAIVEGKDGECSYVEADGATWYIRKQLDCRVKDGLQERKVRWASTREPLENLANAKQAISNFETIRRQTTLADAQKVRQRTVLTFQESCFPRGVARPQSEEDYAASQRWVAHTWPMIRPHGTLDLYPAIYRIQLELSKFRSKARHGGKSYRSLMQQPQIRPLRWNQGFIESGKPFHFNRRTRAALFLQVTGELDNSGRCPRCLGEKLAPFVGCVRTGASQQSWLCGACTNCGTQDNSTCPHHKKGLLSRASYTRTSNYGHAGSHQERGITSGVQRTLDADEADADSDEDEDDDDDDSDSDDDEDEDEDEDEGQDNYGKDGKPFNHLATSSSARANQKPIHEGETAVPFSEKAHSSPTNKTDLADLHAGQGKLPKISKKYGFPKVDDPNSRPRTPPSTQPSQGSADMHRSALQPNDAIGAAALGHSLHGNPDPRHHVRTSIKRLRNNSPVEENFTPEPIERDVMDLLWKYLTPEKAGRGRMPANKTLPAAAQLPGADAAVHGLEEERLGIVRSMPIPRPSTTAVDGDGHDYLPSTTRRKRRASSSAPPPKRPSFELCGQSSSGLASASHEKHPTSDTSLKTFMSTRSPEIIAPKSTHHGCVTGQPCCDYEGKRRPVPRDPFLTVYHNTLHSERETTVEDVEYILSRCNCHWASTFTTIWNVWCAEKGGIDKQEHPQVSLLLSYPDKLLNAAWDCCPRGKSELIVID